jgi:hypothetical protein
VNLGAAMRHLGFSLVIVCMLGCGARPAAAVLSGDVASGGTCSIESTCSAGGRGSLAQPAVVVGAAALGVAAIAYVYHLVLPPAR